MITCGYPTLISQQLDIWDTPQNFWVPKCWIQLDINRLFLHVDLFLEWKHWYLTHTQTQMGVDTTDLDIPSQIKGFDHNPNTPRKPAEWRAPFKVTVLIQIWVKSASTTEESCRPDVFVNAGTGSSWHEDACFKAVLIVFHLRPLFLEDRELLEAKRWNWCAEIPAVGNPASKSSSPLKLSSGIAHSSQRGKLKYFPKTLPMPIRVEDHKKSIKNNNF